MAGHRKVKGTLADDRGIWIVRARVFDPATGRTVQKARSTGLRVKERTKRRAEQAMQKIIAEWEEEANAEPIVYDPVFSEYIQKWLKKKSISLKANSVKSYQDYADVHIIPELGNLRVRDMKLQHLQDYYEKKLETLSVNSLKKQHVVISGALLDAVRDGIIQTNFADYVEFPKAKKFEGKAYTKEQVAALLEAVELEGEPIRAAVILAVCYGLRRSEICGLRWNDIDFDGKAMYIRNTKTQNGKLVIEAEQTKTKKSRRKIDLIDSTIPYFKELMATQEQSGIKLDKVCVWPDGRVMRPDYVTSKTSGIMKKYGLEHIRVHDLRHTAASLLATKATLMQVQDFLGHEDISTTTIYTHLMDEQRRDTANILNNILQNL